MEKIEKDVLSTVKEGLLNPLKRGERALLAKVFTRKFFQTFSDKLYMGSFHWGDCIMFWMTKFRIIFLIFICFCCKSAKIASTTEQAFGGCDEEREYFQAAIESEQIIICLYGAALYNPDGIQNLCRDLGRLNLSIAAPTSASVPLIMANLARSAEAAGQATKAARWASLSSTLGKFSGAGAPLAAVASFVPAQVARLHTVIADLALHRCYAGESDILRVRGHASLCRGILVSLQESVKKLDRGLARQWLRSECPREYEILSKCPSGHLQTCITE